MRARSVSLLAQRVERARQLRTILVGQRLDLPLAWAVRVWTGPRAATAARPSSPSWTITPQGMRMPVLELGLKGTACRIAPGRGPREAFVELAKRARGET
jgi:hypothetical protein